MSELVPILELFKGYPVIQLGLVVAVLFFGNRFIKAGQATTLKSEPSPQSQPQWMTDIHDIRRDVDETKRMVTEIKMDLYARAGIGNFEHLPLRSDGGGK
jgi:hypothetical protein